MKYSDQKVAGILFFIAAAQFILGLMVAEALYPGYSTSNNYVSDLSVGPSSLIFNSSIFLLGLLALIGTYFFQRTFHFKTLAIVLAISAGAAMGVGIFTENSPPIHYIVSVLVFLFSGFSAILSHRIMKSPLSFLSLVLGIMIVVTMLLFFGNITMGLGVGGMERMIVYPSLIWMAGFGVFLMVQPEQS